MFGLKVGLRVDGAHQVLLAVVAAAVVRLFGLQFLACARMCWSLVSDGRLLWAEPLRSRMSSMMAFCVWCSKISSCLAMSRFRSQFGFLGANEKEINCASNGKSALREKTRVHGGMFVGEFVVVVVVVCRCCLSLLFVGLLLLRFATHIVVVSLGLNVVEFLQQLVDAGRQRRRQAKLFELVAARERATHTEHTKNASKSTNTQTTAPAPRRTCEARNS